MIEKKIHVTWKTDKIFDSKCFMVEHGLKNLIRLNPDWEVSFSDDAAIDKYLMESMTAENYNLIKDDSIVAKSDIWRLIKIYREGGLYIDLDRFYNIPLSEIITSGIRWVLPTYKDIDFSQDIMLSSAGNPIFASAAGLNMTRRQMGYRHIYLLGPQTWMNAVSQGLMGEIIESNPGVDVMSGMRAKIAEMPFIRTYREEPWRDTMVFKATDEFADIDYELEKRKMYEEFGMDHWTRAYSSKQ